MVGAFLNAARRYPEITLGAFIVYLGLFFILGWFFAGTVMGSVAWLVVALLFWNKFEFIDSTDGEGMDSPKYEEMRSGHKSKK